MEAENILQAEIWVFSSNKHGNFLTIDFMKRLHKKTFGKTWKWAGEFRKIERNIEVNHFYITTGLKKLLDDVSYQIINKHYPFDEIAYRFHHRLVAIHPFPNGNGRYARLITNLLLTQAGQPRFTWGRQKLEPAGPIRKQYISMPLKKAD